jgi:hypothetical protein
MLRPFTIKSQCIADDATLYAHIAANMARGLPVLPQHLTHDGVAVMVGSGPSVKDQLPSIRDARDRGGFLVAIKDTHDWLLAHDIIPNAAVAIDPQPSRAHVFQNPHHDVRYFIASQVHPEMLDHLSGYHVSLWHAYVRKNQTVPPPGTPLISGGTTTGLRAITLLYSMGFREFELYGYDSCLADGLLRMNGDVPRTGDDTINEIVVHGETFHCNPSMTAQAAEFQNLYWSMPDISIQSHGDGLISAILNARANRPLRTISFINAFGPQMASYRYRCEIPAAYLGASINDKTADVWVITKPESVTVPEVKKALGNGQSVIMDFCDDHFQWPHYRDLLRLGDAVTCSTEALAKLIATLGREATVIDDPYEFDEVVPHCHGINLLWFGRAPNKPPDIGYDIRCVSNHPGHIPWSHDTMLVECARADMVVLPESSSYKSANRAVEAIRQGCFVVAEPHPALKDIPGVWQGNLKEGIEWAYQHQAQANQMIRESQMYVAQRFGPRTVAAAWSRVIQACPSTWGQDAADGQGGLTSITMAETLQAT